MVRVAEMATKKVAGSYLAVRVLVVVHSQNVPKQIRICSEKDYPEHPSAEAPFAIRAIR